MQGEPSARAYPFPFLNSMVYVPFWSLGDHIVKDAYGLAPICQSYVVRTGLSIYSQQNPPPAQYKQAHLLSEKLLGSPLKQGEKASIIGHRARQKQVPEPRLLFVQTLPHSYLASNIETSCWKPPTIEIEGLHLGGGAVCLPLQDGKLRAYLFAWHVAVISSK